MICLLGASGYVGHAFQKELARRSEAFECLSRNKLDYTRYDILVQYLKSTRPSFLINAAGFTGKPNVDACELAHAETLQGNTLFPLTISHACAETGTPWGHVSSGCIYTGAVIVENGTRRPVADLNSPELKHLVTTSSSTLQGFSEADEPNFSFRRPPCSFYSGTKALAEEALAHDRQAYLWRLRIPFNEIDNARNFLSKLQRYSKVYENINSLSHLDDYVRACLDLRDLSAPPGIYNVTNPGFVTSRQVVELIQRIRRPSRPFEFWRDDEEFYRVAAKTPRSNCILDTSKLLATGVKMRDVEYALIDALTRWQPENANG